MLLMLLMLLMFVPVPKQVTAAHGKCNFPQATISILNWCIGRGVVRGLALVVGGGRVLWLIWWSTRVLPLRHAGSGEDVVPKKSMLWAVLIVKGSFLLTMNCVRGSSWLSSQGAGEARRPQDERPEMPSLGWTFKNTGAISGLW